MPRCSEEAPAHGARERNRDSFIGAWKRHRPRLLALCLKWVGGHRQDAEDVLARVALRAVEDIAAREEEISSFPAWLTRLARNTAVDLHRERASRSQTLERYACLSGDEDAREAESVEAQHLRAELHARVRAAVEELPPRLRETTRRRFLEEAAYEEIAGEAGITGENARKRVQEARAILQRCLAGCEGE